jgi:hypothetical protein
LIKLIKTIKAELNTNYADDEDENYKGIFVKLVQLYYDDGNKKYSRMKEENITTQVLGK